MTALRPLMKFCGLMRPQDARTAASLGASYLGVIFAGGPRLITAGRATELFSGLPATVRRVGVFGADEPEQIAALAGEVSLDVVQLHGDPGPRMVDQLRARWGGAIWAVIRTEASRLPDGSDALFRVADAIVLDARVPGRLGGTGVVLDWDALGPALERVRGATPVVLAGGLTPENVGEAVRLVSPDVVDVSSGVESSPGVKDHVRMHAFASAVRPDAAGDR